MRRGLDRSDAIGSCWDGPKSALASQGGATQGPPGWGPRPDEEQELRETGLNDQVESNGFSAATPMQGEVSGSTDIRT